MYFILWDKITIFFWFTFSWYLNDTDPAPNPNRAPLRWYSYLCRVTYFKFRFILIAETNTTAMDASVAHCLSHVCYLQDRHGCELKIKFCSWSGESSLYLLSTCPILVRRFSWGVRNLCPSVFSEIHASPSSRIALPTVRSIFVSL
jgi:hypothetical protein